MERVALDYTNPKELGYDDYDFISDWAKPAVNAAKNMAGLMEGGGGKFDLSGKFTRELS